MTSLSKVCRAAWQWNLYSLDTQSSTVLGTTIEMEKEAACYLKPWASESDESCLLYNTF